MVAGLFTRVRSRLRLRTHSKNLRRLVVTREARNMELARRLAASQGIAPEHFDRWARETVERFERQLELENMQYISEDEPVPLQVEGRTLLFFHGVSLEPVESFLFEYWHPTLTGCVKWSDGGMSIGMRVPFIDPFPTDSRLLERRDEALKRLGHGVVKQ